MCAHADSGPGRGGLRRPCGAGGSSAAAAGSCWGWWDPHRTCPKGSWDMFVYTDRLLTIATNVSCTDFNHVLCGVSIGGKIQTDKQVIVFTYVLQGTMHRRAHIWWWLGQQLLTWFYFHLQEVQQAEEVKNDECEGVQQGREVTLQNVEEPQAESNSVDTEVLSAQPG